MSSRLVFRESRWKRALLSASFCGLGLTLAFAWRAHSADPAEASAAPSPTAASATPAASSSPEPSTAEVDAPKEAEILQSISGQVAAIFEKSKSAIVRIQATDAYGAHTGTGFFVDPNGTIYTHFAVGGASWNLIVEFANKRFPATCQLADPRSGVALLKIEAATPTPFLAIGRSEDLQVASPLIVVGYPLDHPASPSFGLVAGFDQKILDRYLATTHIRANVPVQPGEQGAPVLNVKGEAVGILVCGFDFGATCLALPMRAAEKIRSDYMRFGEPHPGWIGATVSPVSRGEGAPLKVTDLDEATPVSKSGIKNGDVLVQVGATPIQQTGDLRDASFFLTADETVPIVVRREEQTMTFQVRAVRPPWVGDAPKNLPASEGMRLSLPHAP